MPKKKKEEVKEVIPVANKPEVVRTINLPRLPLQYTYTIKEAEEGYYDKKQYPFIMVVSFETELNKRRIENRMHTNKPTDEMLAMVDRIILEYTILDATRHAEQLAQKSAEVIETKKKEEPKKSA